MVGAAVTGGPYHDRGHDGTTNLLKPLPQTSGRIGDLANDSQRENGSAPSPPLTPIGFGEAAPRSYHPSGNCHETRLLAGPSSERGTSTAVYDYARANERILGNESVVFYEVGHPWTFPAYVQRFESDFHCRPYRRFADVETLVQEEELDALYIIKSGAPDGLIVQSCPTLVHAVFENGPHGDRYAFVSRWLSEKYGGTQSYVPHMIDLPWDMAEICATVWASRKTRS